MTFNRTNVELKHEKANFRGGKNIPFNRTNVELKLN